MNERGERSRRALQGAEEESRIECVDDRTQTEGADRGADRHTQHLSARYPDEQQRCREVAPCEHTGDGGAMPVCDLDKDRRNGKGDAGGEAEERATDVWKAEVGHAMECTDG